MEDRLSLLEIHDFLRDCGGPSLFFVFHIWKEIESHGRYPAHNNNKRQQQHTLSMKKKKKTTTNLE